MRGLNELPKPADIDVYASLMLVVSGLGAFVYTLSAQPAGRLTPGEFLPEPTGALAEPGRHKMAAGLRLFGQAAPW